LKGTRRGSRYQTISDARRNPQLSLPIHQIMLAINGIHLLEKLKLD